MWNPFIIPKRSLDRLFCIPRPQLSKWMVWQMSDVVRGLYLVGMVLLYWGSLNPWFLWPIYRYYTLFAFVPIACAMALSRRLRSPFFTREGVLWPTLTCGVLLFMMNFSGGKNANAYVMLLFNVFAYYSLFRYKLVELRRLGDTLSALMAGLLAVSILFHFLYLAGFPLPHSHVAPEGLDYSYENYYFFLLDDRQVYLLIPRFNSVFLEPSHLGMACIFLLYTQIGKWHLWRNRVLFLTIVLTFSLAAYVCLVVLFFSAAWMKGKAVLGKLLLLGISCSILVVGALFYNKGDNLVNVLIVQRLTLNEEGKLEGDNRTSDLFTSAYEKMSHSDEVWMGRGTEAMQKFGSGNAGYRVFIYTYGLVTLFFLVLFFFFLLRSSQHVRAKVVMGVISLVTFIPHAIPMRFYVFIPLYILLFSEVYPPVVTPQLPSPADECH